MKIFSKVYPSTPSSKAERIDLIVDRGGEVCIYKSFHIYFLHRSSHPSPYLTTRFLSTWTQINVLVDRMVNYWMLAKFNGLTIQMIFTPCRIPHLQVSFCFVICNEYSYILEESRQRPVRTRDGTRLAAAIASDLTTDDLGNAVVPAVQSISHPRKAAAKRKRVVEESVSDVEDGDFSASSSDDNSNSDVEMVTNDEVRLLWAKLKPYWHYYDLFRLPTCFLRRPSPMSATGRATGIRLSQGQSQHHQRRG